MAQSSLRDRVLAAAAAQPSTTRRSARKVAIGLVAASVTIAITVFELIGGTDHAKSRPVHITAAIAGARRNYKRGTDVMPWAFAIGRNVMTDAFRKTRKEVLPINPEAFEATINRAMERESIPDDLAVTKQTLAKMREVYEDLPESQRTPYELINGQDLSVSECAEVLGISDNAVKLRIHRVYEALRGVFKS